MKVIHFLNGNRVEKNISENAGFLLTNRLGGYLSLSGLPLSRYEGWFVRLDDRMFKIIENLEIQGAFGVEELRNNFWNVKRKRGDIESFFLPSYFNSLVFEVSGSATVELTLDVRESYDNQGFARKYAIFETDGMIVVECGQDNERNIYLAIKPESLDYSKVQEWILRRYQLDQERNSPPFERYVWKALKLKSKKIVFSVSRSKKEATKEAQMVFKNTGRLKELEKKRTKELLTGAEKTCPGEIKMAYVCSQNSLKSLMVFQDKEIGLYAGLPWFFQFWARDETVSLKALRARHFKEIKEIIFRQLRSIRKDGQVPGRFPDGGNSDSAGWLFKRIGELIKEKKFQGKELLEIKKYLEKSIEGQLKYHTREAFALSGPKETWMDTQDRAGPRIEIQALRLNMYKLAYRLTQNSKYKSLQEELLKRVREEFWNGKFLADGLDDFTIRPNVFLAAYVYPDLLSKKEWIRCFENVLPRLWLEWGGIATIDKTNPLFVQGHTGENPESYHNGDSWFYLNNLTALILYRFDKKRFKKYIDKILDASTKEMLWQGAIGHHAELSSADKLRSQGCWAQAWSSSLYVEAIDEVFRPRHSF